MPLFLMFLLALASLDQCALADNSESIPTSAAERAIKDPFGLWDRIQGKDASPSSTEYLEKMPVNFDKINNPLCLAAATGNSTELDYLLRDGASPDSTDSLGISALSHAILNNKKKSLMQLLSAGASINQKGPFGVTPLMLAANGNLPDLVSLLLLNGAQRNVKNDDGETALSIARRKQFRDIIVLLEPIKKPTPSIKNKEILSTPLPETVNISFEKAAEIADKPSSHLKMPHFTEEQPPKEPKKKLSSLDLELLNAVKLGLANQVPQLIKAGANPNVQTEDYVSPLVLAVTRNDLAVTEELLRAKAYVDIRTEFEMTPLMIAVQNEKMTLIRLLLTQGADPKKENIAGQSACDLGLASQNKEVKKIFRPCLN